MNRLAFLLALPALVIGCSAAVTDDETSGTDSKPIVAGPEEPKGSGEATKPASPEKPGAGEACGNTTCGEGDVCCNPSCGICTKPGMACIQMVCEPEAPPPEKPCFKTGCSGQICADQHIATTCEWREEYACYQDAICERQDDGQCGFRPTAELKKCLAGAGAGAKK